MTTIAEAADAYHDAQAAVRVGNRKAALSGALMALALDPHTPAHRRMALDILGVTSGYKTLPAPVMDALRICAADAALDVQPLSLVVKTIFEADPRFSEMERILQGPATEIESAIVAGQWNWFFDEPIFLAVLARATLISIRIERVLMAVRRHMLLHKTNVVPVTSFMTALAMQLNNARFAWPTPNDERAAAIASSTPLIASLYQPLQSFDDRVAASLPDILRAARHATRARIERARTMATLTEIDDQTSLLVREQYEGFPYPPWDTLGDVQPTTLDQFLKMRLGDAHQRTLRPTILSAGCGTGRGAILLAKTFPSATITALDLSRTSLAYAAMKAEQHQTENVTFGVGDILKVSALNTHYDLVESSGVLHHMANPAAGLAALASVLKPNGVMRIALYSERGRAAVIAARTVLADQSVPDTDSGVRLAREVLLALPATHPARGVVDTPEFFTLDGLHDLIFNVQESRFTPLGLKNLLASAGLDFLGFDIADPSIRHRYAEMFPNEPTMRDLDKWDAFEQNHTSTFAEMYQFWCRRSP